MRTATDIKALAVRYIHAAGCKDYATVSSMLAPDVVFKGAAFETHGADQFLAPFQRMAPIWKRSDIRAVFSEGEQACVLYDFVTDSDAGAVSCVEFIIFRDERIAHVELIFDRVQFAPAAEALVKRASAR